MAKKIHNMGFLDINESSLFSGTLLTEKILHVRKSILNNIDFFGDGLIALFDGAKFHANKLNLNTLMHIDDGIEFLVNEDSYISSRANIEARTTNLTLHDTTSSGKILLSYGCAFKAEKVEIISGKMSAKKSSVTIESLILRNSEYFLCNSELHVPNHMYSDNLSALNLLDESKAVIDTFENHGNIVGKIKNNIGKNKKSTLKVKNLTTHKNSKITENTIIIDVENWRDHRPITLTGKHIVILTVSSTSCIIGVVFLIPGNPVLLIPGNAFLGFGIGGITYALKTRGNAINCKDYFIDSTKNAAIGGMVGGVLLASPANAIINTAIDLLTKIPPGTALTISEKILTVLSNKFITTAFDGALINTGALAIKSIFYRKIPLFKEIGVGLAAGGISYGLAGSLGIVFNKAIMNLSNNNALLLVKILAETIKGAVKGGGKQFITNLSNIDKFSVKQFSSLTDDVATQTFFYAALYGANEMAAGLNAELNQATSPEVRVVELNVNGSETINNSPDRAYGSLVRRTVTAYKPATVDCNYVETKTTTALKNNCK